MKIYSKEILERKLKIIFKKNKEFNKRDQKIYKRSLREFIHFKYFKI